MNDEITFKIKQAVKYFQNDAIALLKDLIRIPSVNHPPYGDEKNVQEFYYAYLQKNGIESSLIYPEKIPGFNSHPARLQEHYMEGRPNVFAQVKGESNRRSLLLLAHADTEFVGDISQWTDDPFSGVERNGRIYGRGSGDDKSGMAIAAMLPLILHKAEIKLQGDLKIASVADEEQGGANGSAALLAANVEASAAIYLDGTRNQAIWHCGLGGGTCHVDIISDNIEIPVKMIEDIRHIIIEQKEKIKENIAAHPAFGPTFINSVMDQQFFNVNIDKINNYKVRIRFFLDTLPGDNEDLLKQSIEKNLYACYQAGIKICITWMSRFLKPCYIQKEHPLVVGCKNAFEAATGRKAIISAGCQSDQGIIAHYGNIPCVLFGCGRRGKEGAPHLPNEFILIEEFMENMLTTAIFTVEWCCS